MKKTAVLLIMLLSLLTAGCFSNEKTTETNTTIEKTDVISAILEIVESNTLKSTYTDVSNVTNGVVSGVYLKVSSTTYMYSFEDLSLIDGVNKLGFINNWGNCDENSSYIIYGNKAIKVTTAKTSISGKIKLSTLINSGEDSSSDGFLIQPDTEIRLVSGELQTANKNGFVYGDKLYKGRTSIGTGNPVNYAIDDFKVTEPKSYEFNCDGFFQLKGEYNSTGSGKYMYMSIVKEGTGESTYYLLNGKFDKKIWLRYGKGTYIIKTHSMRLETEVTIDEPYDGDIESYSIDMMNFYTFRITNTRDESGKFLYPSEWIQSDSDVISNYAKDAIEKAGVKNGTIKEKAKALHDFTINYLEYDDDSLVLAKRKKQDALSCIKYHVAVCEGYTSLYCALLRSQGIFAKAIVGNNGTHAWTNVLDDDNQWYMVDTTWDDGKIIINNNPPEQLIRYDYFWLLGNTRINNDHSWKNDREYRSTTNQELLFINGKEGMF